MMVVNGNPSEPLYVESEYWRDAIVPDYKQFCYKTNFTLSGDLIWRTPTIDWILEDLPETEGLILRDDTITVGTKNTDIGWVSSIIMLKLRKSKSKSNYNDWDILNKVIKEQEIHAIVVTEKGYFEYFSPTSKSDSLRAKSVLINPTSYWIYPRLVKIEDDGQEIRVDFSGNDARHNWTVVSGLVLNF